MPRLGFLGQLRVPKHRVPLVFLKSPSARLQLPPLLVREPGTGPLAEIGQQVEPRLLAEPELRAMPEQLAVALLLALAPPWEALLFWVLGLVWPFEPSQR